MVLLTFEQFTRMLFYSHISKIRQMLALAFFVFFFPLSRAFFPRSFSPACEEKTNMRGKKTYDPYPNTSKVLEFIICTSKVILFSSCLSEIVFVGYLGGKLLILPVLI